MKDSDNGFAAHLRQAVLSAVVLMIVCGLAFPLLLTGLSAVVFPHQANGNLVEVNGQAIGSEFVGQDFTQDYFLKCRPSAYNYNTYTEDENGNKFYNDGSEYAGLGSGSNNYAPSNPALAERVQADIESFLQANPTVTVEQIPTDLLTASGSGLDPHISPAAADIQVAAVAEASGLSEQQIRDIIQAHTTGKLLGVFGETTVNVLLVNLDIAKAMGLV